ncbi:Pyoverdine/dityrosine biosynthesis protein-domain-containing protein [Ampelomyces quisqualis]|uniref:Pyoverdine/dityrosine biosynthesis protein-domain-containing protein n=1 Tax=Ampelomyces quisqualis TaxID=50730 RepID=A0A6A5QU48_AMPQU|nr:Pyoverdine/dityrosine biosynthesis protein-domain-containing protein [Ampelomyces quisqualis]
MNTGSSPYHSIRALFCREHNGDLLSIEGPYASAISKCWSTLGDLKLKGTPSFTSLQSGVQVHAIIIDTTQAESLPICPASTCHSHTIRELSRPGKDYHVGILSCNDLEITTTSTPFREWLETFILLETSLRPESEATDLQDIKTLQTTWSITTLFVSMLKNVASNDEWAMGEGLFQRRVANFIVRNERIQMALPAFPCKSPSSRKVGGAAPDMAERIALRTLHQFAKEVKAIYSPGVTIWIVSDGHVFSDCIGVDDEVVSKYDKDLLATYQSMFTSAEDHECVRFRGLTELFFSNEDAQAYFDPDWIDLFNIDHPIHSKRAADVELARRIMMLGFQSSKEHFRKLIAEQHPPTLSLYRGQARFMQDDLSDPKFLAMSTKQKKKLSFLVAAEMIARNQAYSNLLELLLPNFVRLSIHAHSNRGPKFGICLLPRSQVHAIDAIMDRHTLCPSYEFQVPTPWHNSIIKIKGDDMVYLGKAEIVQKAIDQGTFEGGWVEDEIEGGHFALQPVFTIASAPSTATESTSTVYMNYNDEKQMTAKSQILDVVMIDALPDETKVRLSGRLRGKMYRILELSLSVLRRTTNWRSELASGKREVGVSTY